MGLDPDANGTAYQSGDVISWFPAAFDLPDPPGAQIRRFRDPAASGPPALSSRELVYVTLGSEAAQLPFFGMAIRDCVAGALAAGLPVVVSTGKEVDLTPLEGLEGDLTVQTWVDQDELLQRTRVVVCHTGSGTTLGALQAGVPIVAVPLFADQPYNAGQVAATGCGVRVDAGPDLQADVRDAVQALASGDASGSLAMAAQIAALPDIADSLPWLQGS
jgi:UDP:flavonoid glycosyltransferase YjiC (YdhE family)